MHSYGTETTLSLTNVSILLPDRIDLVGSHSTLCPSLNRKSLDTQSHNNAMQQLSDAIGGLSVEARFGNGAALGAAAAAVRGHVYLCCFRPCAIFLLAASYKIIECIGQEPVNLMQTTHRE